MPGTLLIGTSGFAYEEWKGIFYPQELKNADMLRHYAERFPSVEINYTFRRFPEEKTVLRWREQAPDGFRFGLKANQRISHFRRLRDAGADVKEFAERARLLGDHLGPILVQCPPTLEYDRGLIESFLGELPDDLRFAMEFRHPSWAEARERLAERGVAWCVAETAEQAVDRVTLPSGPFVYLRLRKEEYTDEELREWARSISATLEDGRDVACYLKHEEKATGPRFAERLREQVEEVSRGSAPR